MPIEESRATARRYFEEFQQQRRDEVLEQIIAPHLLESTRQATQRVRSAFPDLQFTIRDQVAEEAQVATVWEARGTHQGEWSSPIGPVAPTGKTITWTATTTLRVDDGKIVEVLGTHWDHLGILQQMGAVSAAQARSGA